MIKTFGMISLGCAKNLVDSERMMAIVEGMGLTVIDNLEIADVIIINTCGFIEPAREESIETIIETSQLKENGNLKLLIVTGCMVQKYKEQLMGEIPEVDIWLGSLDFEEIDERIHKMFSDVPASCNKKDDVSKARHLSTPSYWAYLKVAEGCNNCCAFCTIPQMRGNFKSKSMEEVIDEARTLIKSGVKEINLLAQDTTNYGSDIYGEPKLVELLSELVKEDLRWLRILYSYPHRINEELLCFIADNDKVCKYLDMPIQHSEDRILKLMGRRETKAYLLEMIDNVRSIVPDIALRTTCIVGFPGETEEDFNNLCDFLVAAKFDYVGVFPYSREEDTVAYDLENQIDEDVKEYRYNYLMSKLSEISMGRLERWKNIECEAIIEGKLDDNIEYNYVGRTKFQAPDVDGIIYIKGSDQYEIGDVVNTKIIKTDIYDLMGEVVNED